MSINTRNIDFVDIFLAVFDSTADDTASSFARCAMAARRMEVSCFPAIKVGTVSTNAETVENACLTVAGVDWAAEMIERDASTIN